MLCPKFWLKDAKGDQRYWACFRVWFSLKTFRAFNFTLSLTLVFLRLLHYNPISFSFFFICILGESNRVPFDLPEAESESVAGFITEYSSIYFPSIPLTEYASIISMSYWMIIPFTIIPWSLLGFLYLVCLIRSTLNRLKYDELMTNARIVIPPIIPSLPIFTLLNSSDC